MKKFLLIATVIAFVTFLLIKPTHHMLPSYCAFCDPSVIHRQAFYEDDLVLGLYTHKPIFEGHCLIIPKRHVERFEHLTEEEMARMGLLIQKVNSAAQKIWDTSPYILLQKNGTDVGQTVPHVHFHFIPRKLGDDSTLFFLFRMFWAAFSKPISAQEMQTHIEQLKKELSILWPHQYTPQEQALQ